MYIENALWVEINALHFKNSIEAELPRISIYSVSLENVRIYSRSRIAKASTTRRYLVSIIYNIKSEIRGKQIRNATFYVIMRIFFQPGILDKPSSHLFIKRILYLHILEC